MDNTTDIIKALRRQGRATNEGWQQRGGSHGKHGKAATRSDRRSGKQTDWRNA